MITNTYLDEEAKALRSTINRFFEGWDLASSHVYRDEVIGFLFFDYQNITEPHLFRSFIERGRSSMYIGYLPAFVQDLKERALGAFCVTEDATIAEIADAFTRDPGLADEAAIQYFVRSGFVIPKGDDWAIWFSTYWEIAICGFTSVQDARQFRDLHSDLTFLVNEDVVSRYSTNPASTAPTHLSHHFRHNLLQSLL